MALETAKSIREDFLHQNAFHKVDTFTPIDKQFDMMKVILHFHEQGLAAIANGAETADIFKLAVREDIARASYVDYADKDKIIGIIGIVDEQMKGVNVATA
jgi:V/A-type H+-transporting ATPase subunit A